MTLGVTVCRVCETLYTTKEREYEQRSEHSEHTLQALTNIQAATSILALSHIEVTHLSLESDFIRLSVLPQTSATAR
jgi:uncharacterized Zn finger protein (UPF0148 family)